jgi:hypothetical protein
MVGESQTHSEMAQRITFAEKDAKKASTYARWYSLLTILLEILHTPLVGEKFSPYSGGILHHPK